MGFENDLPVSIKDCNFSDKETCSCFKSMPGSFPYSPQFSKAEEKVIQNLKNNNNKKKNLLFPERSYPVSLPWALGGEVEIKESVFLFMFHLPVL